MGMCGKQARVQVSMPCLFTCLSCPDIGCLSSHQGHTTNRTRPYKVWRHMSLPVLSLPSRKRRLVRVNRNLMLSEFTEKKPWAWRKAYKHRHRGRMSAHVDVACVTGGRVGEGEGEGEKHGIWGRQGAGEGDS